MTKLVKKVLNLIYNLTINSIINILEMWLLDWDKMYFYGDLFHNTQFLCADYTQQVMSLTNI